MEKINLNEYLASNEYPGRGIAVAMAPDGRQMFIGYFIMGRSENLSLIHICKRPGVVFFTGKGAEPEDAV